MALLSVLFRPVPSFERRREMLGTAPCGPGVNRGRTESGLRSKELCVEFDGVEDLRGCPLDVL